MAPNAGFHIPFSIPIWGVVEPDHIHIDTHLNFIFHGDNFGRIIGVAAYRFVVLFGSVVRHQERFSFSCRYVLVYKITFNQ